MFSGEGEPCGEGKGDGGAAGVSAVTANGGGAGLTFFRGGALFESPLVDSMPSIILSLLYDLFLAYRSIASLRPTSLR